MLVDQRRKMPTKQKIKEYWADFLLRSGKYVERESIFEFDSCFACQNEGYVERSHITARIVSKDDEDSNLHLLCKHCHTESEYLGDNVEDRSDYWKWFCSMTPIRRSLNTLSSVEISKIATKCNVPIAEIGKLYEVDQLLSQAQKYINPDLF